MLGNLINKTNDANDSGFSLENLIGSITGNTSGESVGNQNTGSGGLGDLLKQFTGGQQGSGGGLMDIVKDLAMGAQQQQQKNGGGGLLDLIKGFGK